MRNTLENFLRLAAICLLMALLNACSSKDRKVVTVDESAEYKNATSLQPLKRSSPESTQSRAVVADSSKIAQPSQQEQINELPQSDSVNDNAYQGDISTNVVSLNSGASRLEVRAEFEQAWNYLNSNLKTSDLTIFSRNKAAKLIAIGCNGIEADSDSVTKSRWSFFNRDKYQRSEYCALSLLEKRGKVHVSVLNRSGVEVLSAFSEPIFKRLLAQ